MTIDELRAEIEKTVKTYGSEVLMRSGFLGDHADQAIDDLTKLALEMEEQGVEL